jgi:putative MFS transporter
MSDALPLSEASIAARVERLPPSAWHVQMRMIFGMATFFDAFNLITIATVVPPLVAMWNLVPSQIGFLISAGFAGQAVGALFFGYLAERFGRVKTAMACIIVFSIFSLACAFAGTYDQLVCMRFVQGIGLGGEVPIAATYINEIANSHKRGRFFLVYECVFLLGIAVCSLLGAYIVPRFGYYWMFIIGGAPALVTIPLRMICPESPRWLAGRGRLAEADANLRCIEEKVALSHTLLPPSLSQVQVTKHGETRWTELFEGIYLKRTIVAWIMWFLSYSVVYGITTWLPTIYRSVYQVTVGNALWLGALSSVVTLAASLVCAFLIDDVGRRRWMTVAFAVSALPLLWLASSGAPSLNELVTFASIGAAAITTVTVILYLYTPELYPTRMRALGTSWATFWPRVASVAGASMVGYVLPLHGINGVFAVFGSCAVIGCIACFTGGTETKERMLEDLSP